MDIEVEPMKINDVAKELMKLKEIAIVSQHTGSTGLHVHAYIDSVDKVSKYLEENIYTIDGVRGVHFELLVQDDRLSCKIFRIRQKASTIKGGIAIMWEFRFYSRGGQGAVTAAKILTNAAIIEGKFAQAIPSYGQERKGAPIHTYGRISDEPIEVKSYVYRPNCVICFDTSLADVGIDITEGIRPGCTLVVNSPVPVYEDVFAKVCNIDADKLTHEILGEVPPNVAMLGALVKATGCVSIESLLQAIKIKIPGKAGENNAKACAAAYENA